MLTFLQRLAEDHKQSDRGKEHDEPHSRDRQDHLARPAEPVGEEGVPANKHTDLQRESPATGLAARHLAVPDGKPLGDAT